jgi:hypothetical protein
VKVTVLQSDVRAPIEGVEVHLGLYKALTDEHGVVDVELPAATYVLSVRAEGYSAEPLVVDVSGDLTLQVEAVVAPTREEIEQKLMRFEEYPWG